MIFWANIVNEELAQVEFYSEREVLSYSGERSEEFYEFYGNFDSLVTRKAMRKFNTRLKTLSNYFLTPIPSDGDVTIYECGIRQNDNFLKMTYRKALREFSSLMSPNEAEDSLSFFEEHQLLALPSFGHNFDYYTDIKDSSRTVLWFSKYFILTLPLCPRLSVHKY